MKMGTKSILLFATVLLVVAWGPAMAQEGANDLRREIMTRTTRFIFLLGMILFLAAPIFSSVRYN